MDRTRKRKAETQDATDTPTTKRQKPQQDLSTAQVLQLGLKLVDSMKNAKDKTGRIVSEPFLDLPDADQVPDYYDVILLPIAIRTIEDKLNNNEYASLIEVESDCRRLVTNAKQYNEEGSAIFTDAERIRKLIHNWMKANNPAHKDPDYVPFATPIPDEKTAGRKNGTKPAAAVQEPEETPRPKRPTIILSKGRRVSEVQAAAPEPKHVVAEAGVEAYEGKTFPQAQEMLVEDFVQYKDEEELQIYQPFVNLPSRTYTDYYQLIKRPVSLKQVAKRARGQHGRDAATGISDFKTWDAFEEEMSLIWRNAQEYNEDGSDMFNLANEFKEHFLRRLAQVKTKVEEPQSTRIKLNARPKPVIHLGHKVSPVDSASVSPGIPAEDEPVKKQQEQPTTDGGEKTPSAAPAALPAQPARTATPPPVVKTEVVPASPALQASRPPSALPEAKPSPTRVSMPPPPARLPSGSPLPPPQPVQPPPPPAPSMAPAPATFVESFSRQHSFSDALLPRIQLYNHPQLKVAKPYRLDVQASKQYTNHSVTVMIPPALYYLQVTPTVSQALSSGRQYKLFVLVNGTRLSPTSRPMVNGDLTNGIEKRQTYDVQLSAGVNRIEVEIVAVPNRGGSLEVEKLTVFANLMRY